MRKLLSPPEAKRRKFFVLTLLGALFAGSVTACQSAELTVEQEAVVTLFARNNGDCLALAKKVEAQCRSGDFATSLTCAGTVERYLRICLRDKPDAVQYCFEEAPRACGGENAATSGCDSLMRFCGELPKFDSCKASQLETVPTFCIEQLDELEAFHARCFYVTDKEAQQACFRLAAQEHGEYFACHPTDAKAHNRCLLELSEKKQEPNICQAMRGVSARAQCLLALAQKSSTADYCRRIESVRERDLCIGAVAKRPDDCQDIVSAREEMECRIATGGADVCSSPKLSPHEQVLCIRRKVEVGASVKDCAGVYPSAHAECVTTVARMRRQIEDCSAITDPFFEVVCRAEVSDVMGDGGLCPSLPEQYRAYCAERLSHRFKNREQCEQLVRPAKRQACRLRLAERRSR